MRLSLLELAPPAAMGGVFFLVSDSFLWISNLQSIPVVLLSACIAPVLAVLGFIFVRRFNKKIPLTALLTLIGAGFCAAFAAVGTSRLIDRAASSGIQPEMIRFATVSLSSDPRPLSQGRWIAEGHLKETESEHLQACARGRVTIFGRGTTDTLGSGRVVELEGRLTRNKADSGDTPFIFSCEYFEEGVWESKLQEIRHGFAAELERRLTSASPDTGSFMTALLLGRKTDPGSPVMRRFRDSGCIHLLALSGFHVGLIALAMRTLLKPLTGFAAASVLSAVGAVAFLFLTGIRPSLLRAVLMYLLWTHDALRGRKLNPLAYLSTAFIIQILLFPGSAYNLSFQLSYSALAGLAVGGKAYTCLLQRYLPGKVAAALGAGFGAQCLTLPWVASAFGVWRPVGILAAPILTSMTSAAMAFGSVRLFFGSGSVAGLYLNRYLNSLVRLIDLTASPFARVSAVEVPVGLTWLIASAGTILPLILIRSIHRERLSDTESRFPSLHPSLPGQPGAGSAQEMGAELSHQPGSQSKNHFTPRSRSGTQCLGNRPGFGRHELKHTGRRFFTDRFRNRPGLLPLATGVPRREGPEIGGRRRYEELDEGVGGHATGQSAGQSSV